MIIIEIKGPQGAGQSLLAKRIATAEQMSGKSVRLYDNESIVPIADDADADIVIVVTQT